jgi:hypothetical protein
VFGSTLKISAGARYQVPTHHPPDDGPGEFADLLRCMPHINSTLFRKAELSACGGFPEAANYSCDWCAMLHVLDRWPRGSGAYRVARVLAEFQVGTGGLTQGVAQNGAMKDKIMEAFDCLRLEQEPHRRALGTVRRALERAEPFPDYDAYVELAAGLI